MNIVLDLIVIAIVVVMALISAKRGFVRVVVEVVGFVLAVVLSMSFSGYFADITYQKGIEPAIISSINNITTDASAETVDNTWDALPKFITDNADKLGFSKDDIAKSITQSVDVKSEEIAITFSNDIIKPMAISILDSLYAVVIMVVVMFIVKLLAKIINKLFTFSLAGKLNSALGGVLGVIKGIIFAGLFCSIVGLIITFTKNGIWIFNNENIENTYIFKLLMNVIHI